MRTLLALICSFALINLAGAAQQDDQNNPKYKKKGGQSQQTAVQPTTASPKIKGQGHYNVSGNLQQPGTVHYKGAGKKNWQGGTGGNANVSGQVNVPAKNTTFNKTTNLNKTVNKTNFKVQHFNIGNHPNGKYQAMKFNGNFHIAGAQNWRGSKYVVFQNYHPQWHDQGWWRSHHNRITFVFGSPYYWDAGYWYPAWGYDPGAAYYYDGPIYASNPEMDPGQVVANVQSALQEQGYYEGDIDGVLGPQTRAALAEYQSAQGNLEPTGAVDEPTLESLGIS